MDRKPWLVVAALAATFLAFYLSDLPLVPFHPDESSQISMSGDFAALFLQHDWAELAWRPDQPPTPQVQLRLLDAPMMRYFIGLSGWLHGFSTADLNTDWVWWLTWGENEAAGHLPRPELLWASRVPAAVLSALAVVLMFWIVFEVRGPGVGLAAALLLGLNPLVLLHGCRAMAEGALLFFSLLAVWGVVWLAQTAGETRRTALKLGLIALGVGGLVGLAASSKQSALGLLPSAAVAVALPIVRPSAPRPLRRSLLLLLIAWLGLGLGCGLAFWALNPVLYRDPVGGLQAMIAARADMLHQQTVAQTSGAPQTLTSDPLSRLRAAVSQVYFRPPAVWDVPFYLDRLSPQAQAYFAQPVQRLTAWPIWGVVMAGLGAAGAVASARRLWQDRLGRATRAEQTWWWWMIGVLGMVLLTTPFDWQRYFISLVPPACLGAALGLEWLGRSAGNLIRKKISPASRISFDL
jgi:hypothetical protein